MSVSCFGQFLAEHQIRKLS